MPIEPTRHRPVSQTQSRPTAPQTGTQRANAFQRLIAWLRSYGLGRLWTQYFSSSRARPTTEQPLPERRSNVATRDAAIQRELSTRELHRNIRNFAPPSEQFATNLETIPEGEEPQQMPAPREQEAPPKPARGNKTPASAKRAAQKEATGTPGKDTQSRYGAPLSYALRRARELNPDRPNPNRRAPKRGRVSRGSKNRLDRFLEPSLQFEKTLSDIPEGQEPQQKTTPRELKAPRKPLRGIRTNQAQSKASTTGKAAQSQAQQAEEPIYAPIDTQARPTKPPLQSVLGYAFQLLEDRWDDSSLSKEQREFYGGAYQELGHLLLDDGTKLRDAKFQLKQMIDSPHMSPEIGAAIAKELGVMRGTQAANEKPRAQFLQALDAQLVARLLDKPPREAIRASSLRADALYRLLENQFGLQNGAGAKGEKPDDIPAFQEYVTTLGKKMANDVPWLVEASPAAQAFVAKPSHDTLRAMLKANKTGNDIMRQTWMHTQLVLSTSYRSQQYQSRVPGEFHMRPYSYIQQFEFCERQFGISYRPRAQSLERNVQAEMASGMFVAQQLADQYAGRSNPPSADMFALGHMMLAATQNKMSLQESAHIYRAVTSDARPMANFINRDARSVVSHRRETSNHKDIEQRHKDALAQALPKYEALADCFSDESLTRALGFVMPDALSAVVWQGPRAFTVSPRPPAGATEL